MELSLVHLSRYMSDIRVMEKLTQLGEIKKLKNQNHYLDGEDTGLAQESSEARVTFQHQGSLNIRRTHSSLVRMFSVVCKLALMSLFFHTGKAFHIEPSQVQRKSQDVQKCFDVNFSASTGAVLNTTTEEYDVYFFNVDTRDVETIPTNTGYNLFHSSGTLMTSVSSEFSSLCYNPQDCYYIHIHGHAQFTLSDGGELVREGIVRLDKPSVFSLGKCSEECEGTQLVVAGNKGDAYMHFNEVEIIEKEVFDGPTMKKICSESGTCNKIQGTVGYFYMENESTFTEGSTFSGYKTFGVCPSKCYEQPNLGQSPRGRGILQVISSISGMESMIDAGTPQYRAACWLIYEDLRKLSATDPSLLQRYVVMLIYFSLNGRNWEDSYDFHSPSEECTWSKLLFDPTWNDYSFNNGIRCSGEGHVARFVSMENNLAGILPYEISWLSGLQYLHLGANKIVGNIPETYHLVNLEYFFLYENQLTGTIPEVLPAKLKHLGHYGNALTGSLPNFHENLEKIELYKNSLTGSIPDNVVDLNSLFHFDIRNNRLSGPIPSQFFMLPSLNKFCMNNNLLTGTIPSEVVNGSKIADILLDNNFLTGQIPVQLLNAVDLNKLNLENNLLAGEVPDELNQLENLAEVRIQYNNITGIVPFQECSQYSVLESDCDSPQKVICECCTNCLGLFTRPGNVEGCTEGKLRLVFDVNIGQWIKIKLSNTAGEIIDPFTKILTKEPVVNYENCVSMTDCLILTFIAADVPKSVKVFIDETEILKSDVKADDVIHFGYSSTEVMQEDTCDAYRLCDSVFENSTKRDFINKLVKYTTFSKLSDELSNEYSAACAFVDFLDTKTVLKSGLLQQYFLSLLYFATNGDGWKSNDLWTSTNSFCSWYGVDCDVYNMVIGITLSSNNLNGYMPTEIGQLKALKFINLGENSISNSIPIYIANLESLEKLELFNNGLTGSIPIQISFLQQLVLLDLGSNLLSGRIPEEIGVVQSLELLSLYNNSISGDLPDSIYALHRLRRLFLAKNLLAGEVSKLSNLQYLEHLNLRSNFFKGKLPFGEAQRNMKIIDVSNNIFTGSIPSVISELQLVKQFILQNNRLTGTIPNQIGMMQSLSHMSLAFNSIKGSMPAELFTLGKLKLLHLHQNDIVGNADYFDYKVESYITDCGSTVAVEKLTECITCSYCCNIMHECLWQEEAWPKQDGFIYNYADNGSLMVTAMMVGSTFLLFLCGIFWKQIVQRLSIPLPATNYSKEKFQEESVYKFFLTKDPVAVIIAIVTMCFHVLVLAQFLHSADYRNEDNEAAYKFACPSNSFSCYTSSNVTPLGKLILCLLLLVFLASDIADGILLIYESLRCKRSMKRGIWAGSTVVFITAYSFLVSMFYNLTVGMSNIEVLADAAILLFLNDIDERLYSTLTKSFPIWMKSIDQYIEVTYSEEDEGMMMNQDVDYSGPLKGARNSGGLQQTTGPLETEFEGVGPAVENVVLRRQIEHLQAQVNLLSAALTKIQPDLKTFLKEGKDSFSKRYDPSYEGDDPSYEGKYIAGENSQKIENEDQRTEYEDQKTEYEDQKTEYEDQKPQFENKANRSTKPDKRFKFSDKFTKYSNK